MANDEFQTRRLARIAALLAATEAIHLQFMAIAPPEQRQQQPQFAASETSAPRPKLAQPVPIPVRQASGPIQVTNDTIIVRGDAARNVLAHMLDTNVVPLSWLPSLSIRLLPLRDYELRWEDLRMDDTWRSRVNLRHLLKCGVNITDLWACGLARTYEALKDTFGFRPPDLTVNYRLLNMGRMRELYNVTYEKLALDFSVGIHDYLLDLDLSLADINNAGIDMDMMLEWEATIVAVFTRNNHPDPRQRRVNSATTQRFFASLTLQLFMERVRQHRDALLDWTTFLGLRAHHLIRLGMTRTHLLELWGRNYNGDIDAILSDLSATPEDRKFLEAKPISSKASSSSKHF